ncbi:MAG TPA: ATP-dependent DNA helicase RecG [Abditibacteriaceae bacterium]|jgi:ATP-dependent DNA helicase RecG
MLQELLTQWSQALTHEKQTGFANKAPVRGTLCEWMRIQTDKALFDIHQGTLPADTEFRTQRLHDMWSEYDVSSADTRRDIVERSTQLIYDLALNSGISPNKIMNLDTASESTTEFSDLESVQPTDGDSAASPASKPVNANCSLDTELTYLKGIGPKRAQALAKLGLHTVYDLLYHFPARYEDRRVVKPIAQVEIGAKESICGTVLFPAQTRPMGGRMAGRNLTRVRVGDASGRADLQWWNQAWREKQFQPGMQLFIYGKVSEFNGTLQIDSPEFEILGENDSLQVGRIVPVYPMTEGLFQSALRRAISGALERCAGSVEELLPQNVRDQFELADLDWCLQQIHFPDEWDTKERARGRLLFEELFLLQVALAQKKVAAHIEEIGIRHIVEDEKIKEFLSKLPFKLTGAQKRVMNEVRKDLKSPRPMNRLLHGDVGSGKTVVAAYALWSAHISGHQGALLAPTEILAEQHFSVMQKLLKPHGIEVALLEGSLKAKNKRNILADIAEGRSTVVVGTHAIIQEGVEFQKLGVCIIDEQHRFGVMQRAALQKKGQDDMRPDVLVMTATPIPRTMALTVYGDLDVSVLDELPPGRQPIKTVAVKPAQRTRAYKFILDEVKKGRQAYVVCPLVEESEKLAHLQAASALAERLRHEELHDLRVGLLHGQMDVYERDEVMELFRAGMFDVLVSTTVIEVGVDVPNATVMLVEDAERFGLSQLHQLRGRVGRGEHKSHCVLLGNPKTDEGRARISVMTKTQNGFEIAEHDLQLRGPGEFYGTRQSGMPDFRLANIIRDVDTIALARDAAIELVKGDPHLEAPEHQALKHALRRFWGEKISLVQVS